MSVLFLGNLFTAFSAVTPNDVPGETDSARIEAAIAGAVADGSGEVVIPRHNERTGTDIWLLDRAILLPSDLRLTLDDCLVRLAPGVKDNILRNAGTALTPMQGNTNIQIIGKGRATLSGGTACHFNPPGDRSGWRTIGILLFNTRHFTLTGFTLEEPQAWGISMENGCAFGHVTNLIFRNTNRIPNQDGVDVRKGCHDILIENIRGMTGDDSVALTGLRPVADQAKSVKAGRKSMHIGDAYPADSDDIYNITVRNIRTYVSGGHQTIRLLNHDGVKLHDIVIADVYDISSPTQARAKTGVKVGDVNYVSRGRNQMGETYNIFVTNINSRAKYAVMVQSTLKNAVFCDVHPSDGSVPFKFDRAVMQNVSITTSPEK